METNSHTMSNIELTEMWLDGKFDEVIWEITDSKQFMEKDRLIDFCLYLGVRKSLAIGFCFFLFFLFT